MTLDELVACGLVVREDYPLAERTTLRIGGPARLFCEVKDVPALQALLRYASERSLPLLPLGKGSNLLVPDSGFEGVAFVLSGTFQAISIEGETVIAGGGASLMSLAILTRNAGLSGVENLSGIPSSIGGAIRINAGSYGTEIFDLLESVETISRSGDRRVEPASEIPHGYRRSAFMDRDDIIAGATLRLAARPRAEIEARLREVTEKRRNALPKLPNAGSIFRNPAGMFAGKLLEECGMKGIRAGGAEISGVHANVIVNRGGATAADVLALMHMMSDAVRSRFGLELQPEIELVGRVS